VCVCGCVRGELSGCCVCVCVCVYWRCDEVVSVCFIWDGETGECVFRSKWRDWSVCVSFGMERLVCVCISLKTKRVVSVCVSVCACACVRVCVCECVRA